MSEKEKMFGIKTLSADTFGRGTFIVYAKIDDKEVELLRYGNGPKVFIEPVLGALESAYIYGWNSCYKIAFEAGRKAEQKAHEGQEKPSD